MAFTRGPGLLGSLLVGTSLTKGFYCGPGDSHDRGESPSGPHHGSFHLIGAFRRALRPTFPFLCLLVSGGHTQLVVVRDHHQMEIIGQTIDDAAGEAFDKCAKLLGLPYPGGPHVDRLAKKAIRSVHF